MTSSARAYWIAGVRRGEIRPERLPDAGPEDVLVRTRFSGVSAGTERLVHEGGVPAEVAATMRAPFQVGEFPFPVKYGYLAVGEVESGPSELVGRTVFALHPHQDRFVVPAASVVVIPDAVPPVRALLAGAVETALNGLWDAAPLIGDRVAVVGGGLIGACSALLADRLPLGRLVVVEPAEGRRQRLVDLGLDAVASLDEDASFDLALHASATASGLNAALRLLDVEGTLVELSWYGDGEPSVELGAAFHARRLRIVASQVGEVSERRRIRRTRHDRFALALSLLDDPRFDCLLGRQTAFEDLPATMDALAAGADLGCCPIVRYEE